MVWIILIAVVVLIILPPVLRKKWAELNDEDKVLFNEYRARIKGKPFSKRPENLTEDQRKLWARAIKVTSEEMSIKVYRIAGIIIVVIFIIAQFV